MILPATDFCRRAGFGISDFSDLRLVDVFPGGSSGDRPIAFRHPHADTCRACENHDYCQRTFQQHGAVANILSVRFAGHLLATGSTAYKTVESADRTAGNGNKKEGQHRRSVGWKIGGRHDRWRAFNHVSLSCKSGNEEP